MLIYLLVFRCTPCVSVSHSPSFFALCKSRKVLRKESYVSCVKNQILQKNFKKGCDYSNILIDKYRNGRLPCELIQSYHGSFCSLPFQMWVVSSVSFASELIIRLSKRTDLQCPGRHFVPKIMSRLGSFSTLTLNFFICCKVKSNDLLEPNYTELTFWSIIFR